MVALLHSFFSNLPQEWLEGTNVIIKQLRPVTSVAMLRIAFRIMGPVLPKLANAHALFNKVQKIKNVTLLRKLLCLYMFISVYYTSLYACVFYDQYFSAENKAMIELKKLYKIQKMRRHLTDNYEIRGFMINNFTSPVS